MRSNAIFTFAVAVAAVLTLFAPPHVASAATLGSGTPSAPTMTHPASSPICDAMDGRDQTICNVLGGRAYSNPGICDEGCQANLLRVGTPFVYCALLDVPSKTDPSTPVMEVLGDFTKCFAEEETVEHVAKAGGGYVVEWASQPDGWVVRNVLKP